MWESINKILKLIEKTGDKCVILDENHNPFIVMTLTDYEKLNFQRSEVSNLSQEELLDKINREIAVWRAVNKEKEIDLSSIDITEKKEDNKVNFTENHSNPTQIAGQIDSFSNKTKEYVEKDANNTNNEKDEYFIEPLD